MTIPFAHSARSTLGIEWELAIIDPATRDLVAAGPSILDAARSARPDLAERLSGELLENTVEVQTGVHTNVPAALRDLRDVAGAVDAAARDQGLRLISAGTHPFADPLAQTVTASERYDRLIERTRWWGRAMLIYGIHVHVGIDRADAVFPALHGVLDALPLFLAPSASSPWWHGVDTGYASNRTMMFQQLPTAGLPPVIPDWKTYEQYMDDLTRTGTLVSPTENRWDVRPAPHFGTLELRICDAVPTLEEIGWIAALSQCLVDRLVTGHIAHDDPADRLRPWHVRENKWRAARYGVDANIITSADGRVRPLREALDALVTELEPTAARLGCTPELTSVRAYAAEGNPAERLRRAARGPSGLSSAVDMLVDELARSLHGA